MAEKSPKYCSFSLDDTIDLFKLLYKKKSRSIFDISILKSLKKYHDLYGLTVTFYCFYETRNGKFNISMLDNRYKDEFQANSDWMKFGFHALNTKINYENTDYSIAKQDYENVLKSLINITGGQNSIENVIRLANFKGNRQSCLALKNLGVTGLLTADDDRDTYYLSPEESL